MSEPLAPENRLQVARTNLGSHLYANSGCLGESEYPCPEGKHDPAGYTAVINIYAADLLLEQPAGPSVSNVSGELTSAPTIAGTSDVAFSAADPGSGVYEAVFAVDGQVVQRTVLDPNGGRCRAAGQAPDGLPAFLYVQPCLASLSTDVGFDTTAVPNGPHHLVVTAIDAAGNAAPVLDRAVSIVNRGGTGPPNGTNASAHAVLTASWRGTGSERLVSRFGQARQVVGRLLTSAGAPIQGARIDVTATAAYAGARPAALASPTTGPDGRFTLRLGRGASSRTLRFAYRSELSSQPPVATRTLTLAVHAGLRLSVSPRVSSVGGSIRFSGRLEGGPIPRTGKVVVLEARSPGGEWLQFKVLRSDRRGRFHAGYRFRFPGPAKYQFRARSEAEADYPFLAGASNVVDVYEH